MLQPYFQYLKNFIEKINADGGPREEHYYLLDRWIRQAYDFGPIREEVFEIFGKDLLDRDIPSLLSRIYNAPRGYYGAFDIMEDIYNQEINVDKLNRIQIHWDMFILSQISCTAVRHRLEVLRGILQDSYYKMHKEKETISFLDVACGPGVAFEIFKAHAQVIYTGIDKDTSAIAYCRIKYQINGPTFQKCDMLGIKPERIGLHDIVWCAGLFDYIKGSGAFIGVARRLVKVAKETVIIGNMGPYSPSRPFMELLGWKLEYRTAVELMTLGSKLHKELDEIITVDVKTDPTGIQHYLHLGIDRGE